MFKYLSILILTISCGQMPEKAEIDTVGPEAGPRGKRGPAAEPCSVTQVIGGAVITCPDGSTATLFDGEAGVDGSECEVEETGEGAIITCGPKTVTITDGKVKNVNPEPIYEGYFCSRTVVRIGKERYVINSGLVLLSSQWYSIGSCKLRYHNKQIEVN
jgi:hypothetical protein